MSGSEITPNSLLFEQWRHFIAMLCNLQDDADIAACGLLLAETDKLKALAQAQQQTELIVILEYIDQFIGLTLTEKAAPLQIFPCLRQFSKTMDTMLKRVQRRKSQQVKQQDLQELKQRLQRTLELLSGDAAKQATSSAPAFPVSIKIQSEEQIIQTISSDAEHDTLLRDFLSEAEELLNDAEELLKLLDNPAAASKPINALFRCMHTIKGTAGFLMLNEIAILAHHTEDLLVKIRAGETVSGNYKRTIQIVLDTLHQLVDQLKNILCYEPVVPVNIRMAFDLLRSHLFPEQTDTTADDSAATAHSPFPTPNHQLSESVLAPLPPDESKLPRLGEYLVSSGQLSETQVEDALEEQQRPLGQILVEKGTLPQQVLNQALQTMGTDAQMSAKLDMIKISAENLDELGEFIGEMVVALSLLSQKVLNPQTALERETAAQVNQLNRIIEQMRDRVLGMRMLPLSHVFSKLTRQVRDLCLKSAKTVAVLTEGADTLVDKTVIDGIYSPLMHLIRNAIDHGIEAARERELLGKPAEGKLHLSARHAGDAVMIEVRDDGRGLQLQKILAKALEKGLVTAEQTLTDSMIQQLIFLPGFSTAEKITDISGRGVGMDVVKQEVTKLRGKIHIESREGQGTAFRIRLPLTTSIIEGLITRVGNYQFVFPLLEILMTVTPRPEDLKDVEGQTGQCFVLGREIIPVLRLYEFFQIQPFVTEPAKAVMIILKHDERKIGVMVDEILHRQQVVIKPLGEQLKHVPAATGTTILGDGHVGFILEAESLKQELVLRG